MAKSFPVLFRRPEAAPGESLRALAAKLNERSAQLAKLANVLDRVPPQSQQFAMLAQRSESRRRSEEKNLQAAIFSLPSVPSTPVQPRPQAGPDVAHRPGAAVAGTSCNPASALEQEGMNAMFLDTGVVVVRTASAAERSEGHTPGEPVSEDEILAAIASMDMEAAKTPRSTSLPVPLHVSRHNDVLPEGPDGRPDKPGIP